MTAQRETDVPPIPDLRDDNVADVLRAIKSTMQVREGTSGDPLDAFVTYRHLETLGLADSGGDTKTQSGDTIPVVPTLPLLGPTGYNPRTDLNTPPAPLNLQVFAGFNVIILSWDGAAYANHAYTEVWRSATGDFNTAVLIGTSIGTGYTDAVDYDQHYCYWIRFVSLANVKGPFNSVSGTCGTSGADVGKQIEALSKQLIGSALWRDLTARIDQIDTDARVANAAQDSKLEEISARDNLTTSRILELDSVTKTQADSLKVLESRAPGNGTTVYFTPERPDAATPGAVAGIPLSAGDIWYDTNDQNRSYRWSGSAWVEFVTAGAKVYHQASDPASFNGTNWVDASGRIMREGDMWYDSDDTDHPYRWNTSTNAWVDFSGADNSAAIITLEQTKIGVARLNVDSPHGLAGTVFDNNGAIWNNVASGADGYANSVQNWNATHDDVPGTDSELTWHVGIPFAESTKQVGIVTPGGVHTTVEQQFTVMQNNDTTLLAQYTVKIDANGYVAGFGLATETPVIGPSTSKFIVNADMFGIGPAMPSTIWNSGTTYNKNDTVQMSQTTGSLTETHVFQSRIDNNFNHKPTWGAWKVEQDSRWSDLTARLPFIVTTLATVIDGKTVAPGVWMNTASIYDAHITNAMIQNLVADKIAAGTLKVGVSIDILGGYLFGGVNPAQPFPPQGTNFGQGVFLGAHGGSHKFFVGNSAEYYMLWDGGQNLIVKGEIQGLAGHIGGIRMRYIDSNGAGAIYNTSVTDYQTGKGFYLDANSYFRVGDPAGSRLVWDTNTLTIYGTGNKILLSAGGLDWNAISGTPPANVANSSITINADGTLSNAGGGIFNRVSPDGIQAVRTDGANAPPSLVNANIVLTGGSGIVQLNGGGPNSIVRNIVMPGFRIGGGNPTSTYIEDLAINTAQIANLAVGGAQIAYLAVGQAQMAYLNVTGLQIDGEAVTIPRVARSFPGSEQAVTVFGGQHGGNTASGGYQILLDGHYGLCSFVVPYFPPPVPGMPWPPDAAQMRATVVVTYNASIVQQAVNSGCKILLMCVLSNPDGDWNYQTFEFGIINNSPKFAQSAVFVFENVPAVTGGWWLRLQAYQPQNDPRPQFNAQQWTNFYDQVMTVQVMKR